MSTMASPLDQLWGEEEILDFRDRSVTDFDVQPVPIQRISAFVEEWHYSSNVNGLRIAQCFGLFCDGILIGAMIYGKVGMANAWKPYGDKEEDVVELRRLCCVDNTPKCTESYFIGKTLKWMKQNTQYQTVVSYADAFHDHSGTIYQATNFLYLGTSSKGKVIMHNGRQYHDKTIRTKYTNKYGETKLKPFAQRVKDALDTGEAYYVDTPGKHIYVYPLQRRMRKRFMPKVVAHPVLKSNQDSK